MNVLGRSLLYGLVIAATLSCGAGLALAQDDEPAAAAPKEASAGTAQTGSTRARRGRPAAAKRSTAAVRHRIALARDEAVAATQVTRTPPALPAAPSEPAPAEKPAAASQDSGVDSSPAPLDALPGIGAVREPTSHEQHASEPGEADEHGTPHGEGHASGQGEHGAEHGEHQGFSVGTFVLQLVNFGVLLFLLIRFGGRAMNKSLRARHEQLKGDIHEAARLRDEATQKFQAQDKRVADLEKEIAALRASIRQDAAREQVRLLEGAQERAKRIQDDMRFQLNQQVKDAESLLRAEVASASVKLAEELVRKSINTEDERRLAREFVAGFDEPAEPEGAVR